MHHQHLVGAFGCPGQLAKDLPTGGDLGVGDHRRAVDACPAGHYQPTFAVVIGQRRQQIRPRPQPDRSHRLRNTELVGAQPDRGNPVDPHIDDVEDAGLIVLRCADQSRQRGPDRLGHRNRGDPRPAFAGRHEFGRVRAPTSREGGEPVEDRRVPGVGITGG